MKKNIVIFSIIIAISSHLNAMELQTAPCYLKKIPADILDYIASFLIFDDVESEEEFIKRKKHFSNVPIAFKCEPVQYFRMTEDGILEVVAEEVQNPNAPTKEEFYKKRTMPMSWLKKHKNITDEDIYLVIYSPNDTICAMTYGDGDPDSRHNLSIVDTKTNQEFHQHQKIKKYYEYLAISSSGNIFATIYNKKVDENVGWKSFIKIQNLCTQTKEHPVYHNDMDYYEIIAFNKQGTNIIVHGSTWDPCTKARIPQHTIIPLTTTLDNCVPPKKTFSHYCAQKMICKNLMLQ